VAVAVLLSIKVTTAMLLSTEVSVDIVLLSSRVAIVAAAA
jgi:hypothetical protein